MRKGKEKNFEHFLFVITFDAPVSSESHEDLSLLTIAFDNDAGNSKKRAEIVFFMLHLLPCL